MALDPASMQDAIITNLPSRTGRSLDQWITHLQDEGPATTKERVAWLKGQGVGHVTAQVIVGRAEGGGAVYRDGVDDMLDRLFGPAEAELRSRYDQVRAAIVGLVPGTRSTVCKGYVGFSARRQFAAVRAAGGAVEVGLRHLPEGDGLRPVARLGGGAITASFVTDGILSPEQQAWIRAAAEVTS